MKNNIRKLIRRYNLKINWLFSHMTDENKELYHGNIEAFETAIKDLEDILSGIDM
jgi:hypothetical protein